MTYRDDLRIRQIPYSRAGVDILLEESAHFGFTFSHGKHHASLEIWNFSLGGMRLEHGACRGGGVPKKKVSQRAKLD